MQLSYDTSRRRLLQSVTLNFAASFSISSYPPAVYYSDSEVTSFLTNKNVIYYGCIALLCLAAFNLIFVKKMYMHILSAVCFPAQIFILYGLAIEQYTDWTKWNFNGFSQLAFIGGFKLGSSSDLPLT